MEVYVVSKYAHDGRGGEEAHVVEVFASEELAKGFCLRKSKERESSYDPFYEYGCFTVGE